MYKSPRELRFGLSSDCRGLSSGESSSSGFPPSGGSCGLRACRSGPFVLLLCSHPGCISDCIAPSQQDRMHFSQILVDPGLIPAPRSRISRVAQEYVSSLHPGKFCTCWNAFLFLKPSIALSQCHRQYAATIESISSRMNHRRAMSKQSERKCFLKTILKICFRQHYGRLLPDSFPTDRPFDDIRRCQIEQGRDYAWS